MNESVSEFVANKQKKSMLSFVKEFYFGMSWRLAPNFLYNINDCEIVGYFSRMAYQTPGVVLNEISNLLLTVLNSNQVDKRIETVNAPIGSNTSKFGGNDFLKYVGCFDILPLSAFNFAISIVIGLSISNLSF